MRAGSSHAWPIQLKTTRVSRWTNANRYFQFSSTKGYRGCLVVCCALLADETLVWLIPGDKLESVSALTLTENGKWDKPFAVAGDLATSILNLVGAPWWKACSPHDTFYFKPQTQTQQVEVRGLSELMAFDNIRIAFPAIEHSVVDCFVGQGAACYDVQCKTSFRTKQKGFRTDLFKKKSGIHVPYDEGDFELLVVHHPDDPTQNSKVLHSCH